jgi:hypothetical protein
LKLHIPPLIGKKDPAAIFGYKKPASPPPNYIFKYKIKKGHCILGEGADKTHRTSNGSSSQKRKKEEPNYQFSF